MVSGAMLLAMCGAAAADGDGSTYSLVTVALNRSSYEWVLSEFPAVDLTRPQHVADQVRACLGLCVLLHMSTTAAVLIHSLLPFACNAGLGTSGPVPVKGGVCGSQEPFSLRVRGGSDCGRRG